MQPPVLDGRTREDVIAQALLLARADGAAWPGYASAWADAAGPADPGIRLIELFARLAELLIERLNGVPARNFLSFLELTGVERFPGAAAEVPVTFTLSRRAPLGGLVPAGTQVATTQTEKSDARVFETRRPFFATPARIERILTLHPATGRYAELPVPPGPPDAAWLADVGPLAVLTHAEPALQDVAQVLYLGSELLFGRDDVADVTITLELSAGDFPDSVAWRGYSAEADAWVDVPSPLVSRSGNQVTLAFSPLGSVDPATVDGIETFWVAAFLDSSPAGAFQPPVIAHASGTVSAPAQPLGRFDAAFHNAEPLDVSKPFFPFGRRPAYGDAFYFGSRRAFAPDVDGVGLVFEIRPYDYATLQAQFAGIPSATRVRTLAKWQFLNTEQQWSDLAEFEHEFTLAATTGAVSVSVNNAPGAGHAGMGTFIGDASGATVVSVTLDGFQDSIGLHTLHGVESRWLRVLLLSDAPYGHDGVLTGSGSTTRFIGPLFIPPSIQAVQLTYTPRADPVPIAHLRALSGFEFRHDTPLVPFTGLADRVTGGFPVFGAEPALYFAFDRYPGAAFISVFFDLAGRTSALTSPLEGGQPNVAWEYWNDGAGWASLDVDDETLDLTTSGAIGFITPADAAPLALFPVPSPQAALDTVARFWFRARLAGGRFDHPPALRGIHVNTVTADNRSTYDELLVGSSNGEPNQSFALVRAPVLAGELWVRETERPSADEVQSLVVEHVADRAAARTAATGAAVLDVRPVEGGEPEVWVRWRRVPNFLSSLPRSRHFTLDSVAAVVEFGSGEDGLIPPVGRDNLRLRGFQTGGGASANLEAGPLSVKELKSSLPFIDKVFNVQAAMAGASAWSLSQLEEFGPQMLKNRGRPVTTEDYEWMVRQRFSHVARVRCLPVRAPLAGGGLGFSAGAVTVLIVPSSAERRPQPDQGLIRKVREFLAATALGGIGSDIHVKGPDYTPVGILATLAPTRPELASVVMRRAAAALEAFLHPLTGGEDGSGYEFGRPVYLSEVHAVLERIDEVDHVISASFAAAPGADVFPIETERLASSGTHTITV